MSFEDYDFDSDPQWQAFVSSIELTGADEAAQLRRVKAKYYKKNVDPTFELPSPSAATPEDAQKPDVPPDTERSQPQQPTPPSEPTQTNQPAAQKATAPAPVSILPGVNALLQALLIGLMLGFLITMVLQRARQNRQAYVWFMQLALLSHLLRIASTPSTLAVMVSPLLLSTLRLASYVKRVFPTAVKPLLPAIDAALARKEETFLAMAVADISLLGVLIIRMFTVRALLFPFIYLSMLRKRYQSPSSAKYHRVVWGTIGQYAQPVLSRLPPQLKRYVDMGTALFAGQQAQRSA